jgi:hypothetical protein
MAAAAAAMDMVSLREAIVRTPVIDVTDLKRGGSGTCHGKRFILYLVNRSLLSS